MSQPTSLHQRIAQLSARVAALETRQASWPMPGNLKSAAVWLVKTTDPATGTYPTSGPQLPIVFLEPDFTDGSGDDLTTVARSAKGQVYGRSIKGYLPKDFTCIAWRVPGGRRGVYFITPVDALVLQGNLDGALATTDTDCDVDGLVGLDGPTSLTSVTAENTFTFSADDNAVAFVRWDGTNGEWILFQVDGCS